MAGRQYDFILLGATGYTGKMTADYITRSTSTNLKWAIAGRSDAKLQAVNATLKSINPSRKTPDVLTVNLNPTELTDLVKKTKVLLNTVGPYHIYSTPVVQACAENGTHYLDVTGETPWHREIIGKFEATAKKTGAILIPEIGIESAPSDIVAYVATKLIRRVWDCGVMDIVSSLHELTSSGASGGTLATVLSIMDNYSLKYLRETISNPFIISPLKDRDNRRSKYPKPTSYHRSIFQRLTGVWSYPYLGTLATSITGTTNNALVNRTAGLNPSLYGFNFTYEEYMSVSNVFKGFMIHVAINFFTVLLAIPAFRKVAKTKVYQPGDGPTAESSKNDCFEMRCVAVAEQLNNTPRKALGTFRYEGSMYYLTAITLAEGGLSVIEEEDRLKKEYGAGFLTPALLGDRYVDKLEKAGVKIDAKQLGETGSY